MNNELNKLREKIAAVDARLFELVAERLKLVRQVGHVKRARNLTITDNDIEELIMQQNLNTVQTLQLPASLVRSLTALLIDYSTRVQQEDSAGHEHIPHANAP